MTTRMVVPSYFGRIPSREGFIRSGTADQALLRQVDCWLATCMGELAVHEGWRMAYRTSRAFDFLHASAREGSIVCGRVAAGEDRKHRPYPSLGALRCLMPSPVKFAAVAPLAFEEVWQVFRRTLERMMRLKPEREVITARALCPVKTSASALQGMAEDYAAATPVREVDSQLALAGHTSGVAAVLRRLQSFLAPLRVRPHVSIGRGLFLPLPLEEPHRLHLAAFWIGLVVKALRDRDVELVALLTGDMRPRLVLSFESTRGSELVAAWMPHRTRDRYVDLSMQFRATAAPAEPGDDLSLAALRQGFLPPLDP
jgi:type VI secretion system protein ImpM